MKGHELKILIEFMIVKFHKDKISKIQTDVNNIKLYREFTGFNNYADI